MSTIRVLSSVGSVDSFSRLRRMQRRQVVERDALGQRVRILAVDGLDPQEREVALVFFRRTNLTGHRRPCPQAKPADLAGADVNVVRTRQIVIVGAAEEPEAVRQDLEGPLAEHQAVHLRPFFEDLEDEVLFLEARVVADLLLAGE